jgi:ribosome biogenesis protein SSF1/2
VREEQAESGSQKPPKTFVLKRGKMGSMVSELVSDLRSVMEPHTARNLRERRRNALKDFLSIAGPLGVSHMLMLSATERSRWLRLAKLPSGPTLTFRIASFATKSNVVSSLRRPRDPPTAYTSPPLVVLSGFGSHQHEQLVKTTFHNMFPTIDAATTKLSSCKRAVLIHQDRNQPATFYVRHYTISSTPAGTSRKLRKLVTKRAVPDLGHLDDVGDWLRPGDASDAESDDGTSQESKASTRGTSRSRIRLHETGPRLNLQLVKIEEELGSGLVLYHAYKQKSADDVAALEKQKRGKEAEKAKRRAEQHANVQRKRKRAAGLKTEQEEGKGSYVEEKDNEGEDDADEERQFIA